MDSIKQSVTRSVIGLAIFAVITAGLIAATQIMTKGTIEKQIKKAQSKALLQIISQEEHNNDLLEDTVTLEEGGLLNLPSSKDGYIARLDNQPVAVILPVVAENGYSGPISMIVGIESNGSVKGVRVIAHKETPGLGDKIDIKKSDWIKQFEGASLTQPMTEQWKVKKDGGEFDQLTGATITPRAVVSGVHDALSFFNQNKDKLLSTQPSQQMSAEGDSNGH
ncbi:electron transport complex subunit RsxG [Alkalimarinus sediminis]|uniref:Ion-translocating oxidoreductase complex subunit G n=1 Tax=Alkalimarinus sediminis TaxID=1632866 RepID=A0A9E8HJS6_9ALTE|nr:electron transport complex subunit RsxG [Alkalimarinus sediminis]UZW75640.1 electron transport complex subunit RsxG [Alkalimarinus sediminis]